MCPTDTIALYDGDAVPRVKTAGQHVFVHLVKLLELNWNFSQPNDPPLEQLTPWPGDEVFFARYFPPWEKEEEEEACDGTGDGDEVWNSDDCMYCGWPWTQRHRCPAWGVRCHKCGQPNHFARMCLVGLANNEEVTKDTIAKEDTNNNNNYVQNVTDNTHLPIFPIVAFTSSDMPPPTVHQVTAAVPMPVTAVVTDNDAQPDAANTTDPNSYKKPHRKRKKTAKQRKRDQERLQKFLEKKALEQQLLEQGLDVKEIKEIVSVVASSVIVETLTHHGEWDAEHHKATMDQLPEQHVSTMDTKMSTPMEVDEEGNRMLPQRPLSLQSTPKKRIVPNLDLLQDQQLTEPGVLAPASISSSDGDILDSFTDLHTPDDLNTPEVLGDSVFEGELDWEDSDVSEDTQVDPIPEYTAREEFEDEKNWRTVTVGDRSFRIDMKVIEPYKRVLSHGGYYGDGFNAIIVFTGYYLPDKRRRDYHYVMDNLFLYVLSTLELLVVEDYMVVFFHGATPKQRMPSLRWLKRCYEMIDRRLRKNLKSLLIVHPTLWIKTIVTLTKPFISSKFSSKLKYIRGLKELAEAVPMEYIFVPDEIKMFDEAKFTQSAPAAT